MSGREKKWIKMTCPRIHSLCMHRKYSIAVFASTIFLSSHFATQLNGARAIFSLASNHSPFPPHGSVFWIVCATIEISFVINIWKIFIKHWKIIMDNKFVCRITNIISVEWTCAFDRACTLSTIYQYNHKICISQEIAMANDNYNNNHYNVLWSFLLYWPLEWACDRVRVRWVSAFLSYTHTLAELSASCM